MNIKQPFQIIIFFIFLLKPERKGENIGKAQFFIFKKKVFSSHALFSSFKDLNKNFLFK